MKIITSIVGLILLFFGVGLFASPSLSKEPDPQTITLYKSTMHDMREIWLAIENYLTDFGCLPEMQNIKKLAQALVPKYLKKFLEKDAWGKPFFFKTDDNNPDMYWIASGGSDGEFNGFDQIGQWNGWNGQDLIWMAGEKPGFVFGPKK